MQASCLGLCILSTAHRKSGSDVVWQCWENEVVAHYTWTMCSCWWWGTYSSSTGK
jgi:hypothetical protein